MKIYKRILIAALCLCLALTIALAKTGYQKPAYYIRFKIDKPAEELFDVIVYGHRHDQTPWQYPRIKTRLKGREWSDWVDLSAWSWHGKMFRSGGVAEYPSIRLLASKVGSREALAHVGFEVHLSDRPDTSSVVLSFTEKSESNEIAFLAPYPLRNNFREFETATQMARRHLNWANEATENKPIILKKFEMITPLWSTHFPSAHRLEATALKSLGFNVVPGQPNWVVEKFGFKHIGKTWNYRPEPDVAKRTWEKFANGPLRRSLSKPGGRQKYREIAYYEISDEVSALEFRRVDQSRLNGWFRDYVKDNQLEKDLKGSDVGSLVYPTEMLFENSLRKSGSNRERRLLYHSAKFGQWWSARQLRYSSDLIKTSLPNVKTGTLLPSHGFLGNAWGPTKIGMSYRMLDIFDLARQRSVDQLGVEDWMGLNHMYGPGYTWTGGQTFGYYNAIVRSAIDKGPILQRALITPSDDEYLRLKAHSSLMQGAKSFYFWAYGPTYVGTENYWSDLRSQYDGIAKLNRALVKTEHILHPAKPVADPVAIMYSVSHDIWNNLNQGPFVEKRLLWHALRHLNVQPNFVDEQAIENGALKNYRLLYITDWNITRGASKEIDQWVKDGGVLYLSAGAATRDEYNSPFLPPFSKAVWTDRVASRILYGNSTFNERTVLPTIKPLDRVDVNIGPERYQLPVIGARLDLRKGLVPFAFFKDGKPAAAVKAYGKGQIVVVGFMPMLAYGQQAQFQPKTLGEKWKPWGRRIARVALDSAAVRGVIRTDTPVVESGLLDGERGAAIVLANYTYKPIRKLTIDVGLRRRVSRATTASGNSVEIVEQKSDHLRLRLPLDWTEIIILEY